MNKFLFKSNDSDLLKLYINRFDLINKNILYITHRVDHIVKLLDIYKVDTELQTQVNEYFGSKNNPEDKQDID